MTIKKYINVQLKEIEESGILNGLNQIQMLFARSSDIGFMYCFLLPMPLWMAIRTEIIIYCNKELKHFRKSITYNPALSLLSGTLYAAMVHHLYPIIMDLWQIFKDPMFMGEFLISHWNTHTFRTVWLITANVFTAKWCLGEFKLTDAFHTHYEAIKQACQQKLADSTVQIVAEQDMMTLRSELMKTVINQVTTQMLANGDLNEVECKQIIDRTLAALNQVQINPGELAEQTLKLPDVSQHSDSEIVSSDPFS